MTEKDTLANKHRMIQVLIVQGEWIGKKRGKNRGGDSVKQIDHFSSTTSL